MRITDVMKFEPELSQRSKKQKSGHNLLKSEKKTNVQFHLTLCGYKTTNLSTLYRCVE